MFVATPSKYTILCDLSVVAKVTVAPEPDAAFSCTVYEPDVLFFIR